MSKIELKHIDKFYGKNHVLKDLNLTDRFLFDMVMEDLQTQQDVLSIIFGRDIPC